jgi:hypothetical protein
MAKWSFVEGSVKFTFSKIDNPPISRAIGEIVAISPRL